MNNQCYSNKDCNIKLNIIIREKVEETLEKNFDKGENALSNFNDDVKINCNEKIDVESLRNEEGRYCCRLCPRSYKDKKKLYRHVRNKHSGEIDNITSKILNNSNLEKLKDFITTSNATDIKINNISIKSYNKKIINASIIEGKCICGGKFTKNFKQLKKSGCYCPKCTTKNKSNKAKQTCMEKFGVENPMHSSEIVKKQENTMQERYGVTNPFLSSDIQLKAQETQRKLYGGLGLGSKIIAKKIKKTCLEEYGVEHAMQNLSVKEKSFNTQLKLYGGTGLGSKIISKKIRNTMLQRYGIENPMESQEFIQKIKDVFIEKYGEENPMYIPEFVKKQENTMLEKYGVTNLFLTPDFHLKAQETQRKLYGGTGLGSKIIAKKIKNTMIERYGVENPMDCPEFVQKIVDTMLERYNVINPMHVVEFFEKCTSNTNSFTYHEYVFENGKVVKCQGYEPHALRILENLDLIEVISKNQNKIECKEKTYKINADISTILSKLDNKYKYSDYIDKKFKLTKFWYDFNCKQKRYYPDIGFLKCNTIIEVKSTYSFENWGIEKNIAKALSVIKMGFNFEWWIFDKNKNLLIIDSNYINKKFNICRQIENLIPS